MDANAIREAMHRVPFQPFRLRLADGREILVPHPDYLAVAARRIVFINPADESTAFLEPLLIVSLEIPGTAVPPVATNDGATA